jgi:hypothetical protein
LILLGDLFLTISWFFNVIYFDGFRGTWGSFIVFESLTMLHQSTTVFNLRTFVKKFEKFPLIFPKRFEPNFILFYQILIQEWRTQIGVWAAFEKIAKNFEVLGHNHRALILNWPAEICFWAAGWPSLFFFNAKMTIFSNAIFSALYCHFLQSECKYTKIII